MRLKPSLFRLSPVLLGLAVDAPAGPPGTEGILEEVPPAVEEPATEAPVEERRREPEREQEPSVIVLPPAAPPPSLT